MPMMIEALADEMYALISEYAGKRNLKAGDLTKEMIARHGEAACSKDDCKLAIRSLIESRTLCLQLSGRIVHSVAAQGRRTLRRLNARRKRGGLSDCPAW